MNHWYQLSVEEVLDHFGSSATEGLESPQVMRKRAEYGPNALATEVGRSLLFLLWEQLGGPFVLLLLFATCLFWLQGQYQGAAMIAVLVMVNAGLGWWQQRRSERVLAELKKFVTSKVRVRREGGVREITSRELVPGDIVLLERGCLVPADCRLGQSINLRVNEKVFTTESTPIGKQIAPIRRPNVVLAEQSNMVFMGTEVCYGRGWGIVTEIGMSTELGQIAGLVKVAPREPTPWQRRLSRLNRQLSLAAIGLVILIVMQGWYLGLDFELLLQTAMSMVVAVIPESLAAVATVTLAIHARRMLRRRALIRHLPAVELLGSVTTICSEKTGVLTRNQMAVTTLALTQQRLTLFPRANVSTASAKQESDAQQAFGEQRTNVPARGTLATSKGETERREQQAGDISKQRTGDISETGPTAITAVSFPPLCNRDSASLGSPASATRISLQPVRHEAADRFEEAKIVDAAGLAAYPVAELLAIGAALCNDAILDRDTSGDWRTVGDPTDDALAESAAQLGWPKPELEQMSPRVAELPFDATRRRMTTFHEIPDDSTTLGQHFRRTLRATGLMMAADSESPSCYLMISKGAVESVLEICQDYWVEQQRMPLDAVARERLVLHEDQLAAEGRRVLGVAWKVIPRDPTQLAPRIEPSEPSELEQGLIFAGMLAMIEPLRPESRAAVERCQAAGIRPILVTGDHPGTAAAVARQLGMPGAHAPVLGNQLIAASAADLHRMLTQNSIFARVTPEQKRYLVQALREQGEVVSMTGDGISDAPALQTADIGVAMGMGGTDVASAAAELVLLDDNFATLVDAIEEGRAVHDNLRKFIIYLLTSNLGEIGVMLIGPLVGLPLPLSPLQILWLNLVTDGLPALAFALEPPDPDIMRRPPTPADQRFFTRGLVREIGWMGLFVAGVSLAAALLHGMPDSSQLAANVGTQMGQPRAAWQTMLFTVLTLTQVGSALALRSRQRSVFQLGLGSNPFMLAALVVTLVTQLLVIYLPFFHDLLQTVPLSPLELLVCCVLSTLLFWMIECKKWWQRRRGGSGESQAGGL